jgi:hypothetical protein
MKYLMITSFRIFVLLLLSNTVVHAQQGARIGFVSQAGIVGMVNADDDGADDAALKVLPTFGTQNGIDAAYHWRYFGIGAQLLYTRNGQKYNYFSQTAETKLNYIKPCLLIHFNTNPKNPVRLSGYVGGAYGALQNYAEISQITNPVTKAITYTTFKNNEFSIQDTGFVSGTLSEGIYYKSDASIVGSLGLDFRMSQRWLLGMHFRVDLGMEKLENYNKIKMRYEINNVPYTFDYEHWKNKITKFETQPLYNSVRKPSTNISYGVIVSLKYLILSEAVNEYERYGY